MANLTPARQKEVQEALAQIRANPSTANFETVYEAFMERGLEFDEIEPKENVLTYRAWQALGRQVRKGEKGVQIKTIIRRTKKGADPEDEDSQYAFVRRTTVFHISQTDEMASA